MNDDGTMARLVDLASFSGKHNLKIGTIADLIAHRRRKECLVKRIHEGTLDSRFGGNFKMIVYANTLEYAEHIVLVKGDIASTKSPVRVRMHAVDILGIFWGKAVSRFCTRPWSISRRRGAELSSFCANPTPET